MTDTARISELLSVIDRLRAADAEWGRLHQQVIEERAAALREVAVQAERISVLERTQLGLRAAISWVEPPFVDDLTPHEELRFRVDQCVKDAIRTLTGAR